MFPLPPLSPVAPLTPVEPRPRLWESTTDWFTINREWQHRPPAEVYGSVEPGTVEAASGHTFVVTFRLGPQLTLARGAHVTMEVPSSWEMHLGNGFRRAVRTVGSRAQNRVGYGAFSDVACSNPDVGLDIAASWGRHLDLVDVVVTRGVVLPGDSIRLVLGAEDGNLVQAQHHAQIAVLTSAVDLAGDGCYFRAATHPTVRVVGAAADRFRVFAPGVAQPGEPFSVRVLPVDEYRFNPAPRYRGTAQVLATPGLSGPETCTIDDAQASGRYGMAGASLTYTATGPGIYRLSVLDEQAGLYGRSNPIGAGFLSGRGVYFGELHSQMWHSMGSGTTEEFFEWGRDVAGLDFCAPANHYGRRFEVTDEVWRALVDSCNAYNTPGRFVTLVSYEWGGHAGSGHKNVYYRGAQGEFAYWYRGDQPDPDALWRTLRGRDVLTVPHHTKFGSPTDWRFRDDLHQRLVEICSQWGVSETGGPHSVQAALRQGHRLGFVGGTDSHHGLANQGEYHVDDGNGLACVVATELTRDAIWQALYDRRCYATTGERILLDVTLSIDDADGGAAAVPMGRDLEVELAAVGQRTVRVRIAGTATIDRVEVLRNNEPVFTAQPGTDVWDGEWTDAAPLLPLALPPVFPNDRPFVFYYVRVTQANRQYAWASPIWLTQRA